MTSNASGPDVDENRHVDTGAVSPAEQSAEERQEPDQTAPPSADQAAHAAPPPAGAGERPPSPATEGPDSSPPQRKIQIGSRRGMIPKALKTTLPRLAVPPLPAIQTGGSEPPVGPPTDSPSAPPSAPPLAPPSVMPSAGSANAVTPASADSTSSALQPAAVEPSSPPAATPPLETERPGTGQDLSPAEPDRSPVAGSGSDEPIAIDERELEVLQRVAEQRAAEQRGRTVVPPPSRRDPLTPELEQQLQEAMANVSLDRLVNDTRADVAARSSELLEQDTRLHAVLVRIHGDNAFFALGGRNEGVASMRQFRDPPSVGAEMEVVVKKFHPEDGLYELAIPGQSIAVSDWSDLTEGAVVESRITGANTGGLECMVNTIRGFIPASQIGLFRVEDFAEYIGQKLLCVVTEVNRKRKNLVLSHRALAEREKEESRKKLIEELAPGQVREGVVRSIQDFGAFVDLGGVDGLIHISQLSWERVNHPSEILQEGQKVRVKIEKVNHETGKIGLSYRDLLEHPWSHAEEKFTPGALVKGIVSRVAKFGAFVKLAPGVEGLVHISELAHHRVRAVSDVVSEGQEVDVKILSVDPGAQRIALSVKAALPEPAPEEPEPAEESHAAQHHHAPSRRPRPLKGGFDRPTGGEQFGLRW